MAYFIIAIYLISFVLVIIEQARQANKSWTTYRGSKSAIIGGLIYAVAMAFYTSLEPDGNEQARYFLNGIEIARGSVTWLNIGAAFMSGFLVSGGSLLFVSWLTAGVLAKNRTPERTTNLLASFSLIGSIIFIIVAVIFVRDEILTAVEIAITIILSLCIMVCGVAVARISKRDRISKKTFLYLAIVFPFVFSITFMVLFIELVYKRL